MRLLAQLTNEVGTVEYVIAVLRYVTATRAEATPDLLRKAMDAASINAGEDLMSNWVEDLIEQGKTVGKTEGKIEGKIEGRIGQIEGKTEGRKEGRGRSYPPVEICCNTASVRWMRTSASPHPTPIERLETLSTVILDARSMADVHDYLAV